jgi:hypothetical protein
MPPAPRPRPAHRGGRHHHHHHGSNWGWGPPGWGWGGPGWGGGSELVLVDASEAPAAPVVVDPAAAPATATAKAVPPATASKPGLQLDGKTVAIGAAVAVAAYLLFFRKRSNPSYRLRRRTRRRR